MSSWAENDTDSIISVGTSETRGDNPGPGRALGKLYDALGNRLENAVNQYGMRRGWEGNWERYRIRNTSEVSRNATAPNLAGPGRALDILFTRAGRMLEVHMNKFVESFGFGPEALHWKIYEQFTTGFGQGTYGLSRRTPHGWYEFLRIQRLLEETAFIADCRRLLQYIQSDVPVNQASALSVLASLAISNPYLKNLLQDLGAIESIVALRPRLSRYPQHERELLQATSRKALLHFSELRCNSIAKDIHDMTVAQIGTSIFRDFMIEDKISEIVKLIDSRDPDISYIAIRHLVYLIPKRKKIFETMVTSSGDSTLELLARRLVAMAASDFDSLDWASVDELVRNCLFRTENILWRRSTSILMLGNQSVDAWAMVVGFVLRWPELLPSTNAHIRYTVDEKYRLLNFGSDWVSPAYSPLLQLALRYVSVDECDPVLLSDIFPEAVPVPFPGRTALSNKFEVRVRESISSLSDNALAEVLLERRLPEGVHQIPVTELFVPRIETIQPAVARLIETAVNASGKADKQHTRQNVAYIHSVDRYCKRTVLSALEDARIKFADEPDYLRRVEKLRGVISGPKESIFTKGQLLEVEAIQDKKHFVLFRHLVEQVQNSGERNIIHLRSTLPFGRHIMCMVCLMSGDLSILDPGAPPKCDALYISPKETLWLEVREDEAFVVNEEHDYILAGSFQNGMLDTTRGFEERHYIAVAFDTSGVPQWCTVQDGDNDVRYYDSLFSMPVTASRFFVMVLRQDPIDEKKRRSLIKGKGKQMTQVEKYDTTGPLYWEPFEEKSTIDEFGLDVKGGMELLGF